MARDYEGELDELREEVSRLTRRLERTGQKTGQDIKEEAKRYWDKTSGEMKRTVEEARKKARQMSQDSDRYAKEHPWQVAGMAAMAGMMMALLMSRRR